MTFTSSDADGRIILINLTYNGLKLSFCNINAPNDHTQQVNFIRELNCLSIDKSEITSLIVGGEWIRPFPSSILPPLQSESTCEAFVMVISSTLHMNEN